MVTDIFFHTPIGGVPYEDWTIVNYVDLDPSQGILDFNGGNYTYNGHNAIDFTLPHFEAMDSGVPVYASLSGTVTNVHDSEQDRCSTENPCSTPENVIEIDHGNGLITRYVHLRKNSASVSVGQSVEAGQQIGEVGSSGNSSDAHLHFEVYKNGNEIEINIPGDEFFWQTPIPYANDVVGSLDHDITGQPPTFPELRERPESEDTFLQKPGVTPYIWTHVHGVNQGDDLDFYFRQPDKTQYAHLHSFAPQIRYGWWFAGVNLPDQPDLGVWEVEFQINGTTILTDSFTVQPEEIGNDLFIVRTGEGTDTFTNFGGVGTGINPTQAVIDEVDTLQFSGSGLTPENMLLTQNGLDLEIVFEGVDETKVILQNFNLEDLDNLTTENSASVTIGNILFDGQIEIEDSFDVVNASDNRTKVFNRNTVTFLNDLNNRTSGFSNSDDVINGQGGDDSLSGRSGNDLLRGGLGDDTLVGNTGSDTLNGNEGSDLIIWNNGDGSDLIDGGSDPFVEPHEEDDPRAIDTVRVNASPDEGDEFQLNSGGTEVLFQRTNLGPFELDISSVEELEVNGRGGNDSLEVGDLSGTSIETIFFNGGAGNDVFDGSNATTRLVGVGGSGNDVLIGGSGEDSFSGSDGNDIVVGGDGSGDLTGGTGSDVLIGGSDADTFRFFSDLIDGLQDIDTIQDFQAQDTLDFFTDYIGSDGTIEFTRVSSGFLQINLSGEDVVNVFGSQSALNGAEAQLTNQIENFDIFP